MTVDQQIEILDPSLTIPAKKLDADHYAADDIDGVTESIFGSGNLAYASLQASQTDAAMALNEAAELELSQTPAGGSATLSSQTASIENLESFSTEEESDSSTPAYISHSPEFREGAGAEITTEGSFSSASVAALNASAPVAHAVSLPGASGLSAGDESLQSSTTTSTTNNETNIVDVGDTVQNVVNTVSETITHITNLGDELVDNIVNLGDDIIENILEGDVTGITEIVTNEVTNITDTLNSEINNIVETVNNFLDETGITEITNQVAGITDEITNNVTGIVNGTLDDVLGSGLAINVGTDILDSLGTDIGIAADDSIVGNISTDLIPDNLGTLANDLTGLDIPLVSDTGVDIGFDLLGGSDPDDGEDIAISGLSAPDIASDPVEAIAGDIDLNTELPTEIADPGALIESAGSIVENLDDPALTSPDEVLDVLGGQGADGAFDIAAGDTVLNDGFDASVDSIIQDVESTLDTEDPFGLDGTGIGDAAGLFPDSEASGLDDAIWTESTGDAGGLFDDITSGIGGEADALPDPVGTVAEGMGALDVVSQLDSSGLGGLFG